MVNRSLLKQKTVAFFFTSFNSVKCIPDRKLNNRADWKLNNRADFKDKIDREISYLNGKYH